MLLLQTDNQEIIDDCYEILKLDGRFCKHKILDIRKRSGGGVLSPN